MYTPPRFEVIKKSRYGMLAKIFRTYKQEMYIYICIHAKQKEYIYDKGKCMAIIENKIIHSIGY